eukprot:scaffold128006_cov69-Phaeocystis_antarctica.AAC.4
MAARAPAERQQHLQRFRRVLPLIGPVSVARGRRGAQHADVIEPTLHGARLAVDLAPEVVRLREEEGEREESTAAYTPRAGGAPAETAPEVAAAAVATRQAPLRTTDAAAAAAAVLRMRPMANTKSAVKTLFQKTSPGSTRCRIVPFHRRHSHNRDG